MNFDFELLPSDPKYVKLKSNTRKYLTKTKVGSIIKDVNKLKVKDNKMANDKIKKSKNFKQAFGFAWMIEAGFRGFAGWVLLSKFTSLPTTIAGVYALATAFLILAVTFWRAQK